jgi:hypothetical protein
MLLQYGIFRIFVDMISSYVLRIQMVCQYLVRSLDCDNGHIFQQLLRQLTILAEPLKEFANGTFDSDKYSCHYLVNVCVNV